MNLRLLGGAALACALVLVLVPGFAFAADSTTIPYGDWISQFLNWTEGITVTAVIYLVGRFVPDALRQYLTNQLTKNAVDYAIAAVGGAVQGKTLTIATTNQTLAVAEHYAVVNGPVIAARLGATLRPKILARLGAAGVVAADTTATSVDATLPSVKS